MSPAGMNCIPSGPKHGYCMKPECQAKNLKGLSMVAVGVNKSAEQYLLLDEDTQADLARGKYHDQRRGTFGPPEPGRPAGRRPPRRPPASPGQRHPGGRRPGPPPPRPPRLPGTASQRRLAVLYNQQGLRPDEIAGQPG